MASDKMYKKRFRDWDMRKNYTKEQKQEIIKQLTQPEANFDTEIPLTLNGEPVKMPRLNRLVQKDGKRFSLLPRPHRAANGKRRARRPDSNRTASVQRLRLQQSPETQHIEQLLKCADAYYSWYKTQNQIKPRYHHTSRLRYVFSEFTAARSHLSKDVSRAFAIMNRCCSGFLDVLQTQPFQLMLVLTKEFAGNNLDWDYCWPVRQSILRYFADLASTKLGVTHPISNYLTLLALVERGQISHLPGRFVELLTNHMDDMFGAHDVARTTVERGIASLLVSAGLNHQASRLLQRLRDTTQILHSPPIPQQRTALMTKYTWSIMLNDDVSAERQLTEQVNWSCELTGLPNGDRFGVIACAYLCWLLFKMGRHGESEQFHRLALEGGLRCNDITKAQIRKILASLEDPLERREQREDLDQLVEQYGDLWEDLEEWKIDRGYDKASAIVVED